tara:strand:+ start:2193 stop:2399 length:207 start_codon:yes stop_codon:yes gene_type:complete
MDNLIDKKMHELHQVTPDIDDFLDEAVNILRESSITYEVFCEWYESIPDDSFSNDLVRIYDDWDFYFD